MHVYFQMDMTRDFIAFILKLWSVMHQIVPILFYLYGNSRIIILSPKLTSPKSIPYFLIIEEEFATTVEFLKNKKSPVLTGLVLFGCTVLFSSVVNSFCHGFTDISTSYMRTVWGFVAAIPPGLVAGAIWGMKSKALLWVKSVRRTDEIFPAGK